VSEGNSRARLGIVGIIVMALFSGLFARLWFLQIGSSTERAAAQTRANRVRIVTEPGVRGSILDRNGKVLVENKLVDSLQVRHGMTPAERRRTIPNLARLLGLKPKQVAKRIDDPRFSPYQPVPIADDVDYKTLVYIKERPEEFPKVEAVRRSIRVYPSGLVAPHLLGYVGSLNKNEQRLHRGQAYASDDLIGKDGVEQVFESELRGKPHIRKLEVDSRGRLVRVLNDRPAKVGNDVQLTMDVDVQHLAEESLQQGMAAASKWQDTQIKNQYKTFTAGGGAVVVLDAHDGSVVALASAPTFDVREFTNGLSRQHYQELNDPKNHYPLLDRATQGLYAPGSTFKLFTAIAALQDKVITPDFTFNDDGCVTFGDDIPKCNAGKAKHGIVNLEKAVRVSSDVFFYNLGYKFWKSFQEGDVQKGYGIQNTAREFGFGRATGIGLPNEARGRIPDKAFKKKLNRDSPDPFTRAWLPGDSANVAVGQGDVIVTPIQLASGYAAFINGGKLFAPRLAEKILTPGHQSVLRDLPSRKTGTIDIPDDVRNPILSGLLGAVNASDGTARPAFNGYTGLEVAGKTGTAQQGDKEDNALFVGLVNPNPKPDAPPEQKKQYVIAVIVEEAGFGGSVAAPIARRIIDGLNDPTKAPDPVQYRPQKSSD